VAIKPVLIYRNSDSTLDLNSRSAKIIDRGIFDGGQLTPSGSSLSVSIAPFIAAGYDGVVAISDSTEALSVPAPSAPGTLVSYIILHLEYRSLTSTIANLLVVPESTWLTSVSRNYFVTFARVSVPFGATSILSSYLDYSVGDWADKLGKTGWRSPVANVGALPTTGNRDGDVRITLDTLVPYVWDAGALSWGVLGGALDLSETTARETELHKQFVRSTIGSGLISGINDAVGGELIIGTRSLINGGGVPYYEIASANAIGIQGAHWVVNGHFVKTRAQQVTLTAPPVGAAPRYDLIYLQVWRETIVGAPSDQTYTSDAGAASSFSTLRDALERFLESGSTPNYDFGAIEYRTASQIVVTRYSFGVFSNCADTATYKLADLSGAFNSVDGTPFDFSGPNDQRVLRATAVDAAKVDGVIYALPLLIVKRPGTASADPEGPGNYIQTYRPSSQNRRFVFDVAPRTEAFANSIVGEILRTTESSEAERKQLADGFLTGTETPISGGVNQVFVPEGVLSIHGYLARLSDTLVSLPAPPATDNRRDFVVLEISKASFRKNANENTTRSATSGLFGARLDRQGFDVLSWSGRYIAFSSPIAVAGTAWLDEDDAMAATSTVSHPILGAAWGSYTKTAPGIWRRTPTADEEIAAGVSDDYIYAIPICLVHRRNTGSYSNTNQNGADVTTPNKLGLPNTSATIPQPREILDLRRKTIIDEATLDAIMDESWEKLLRGELNTKFAAHPYQSVAVGTTHTIIDQIATSGLAIPNVHRVTNGPDGQRTVWSESAEVMPMAWSFYDTSVLQNDASISYAGTPCFAWNGGGSGGTLTLRAPAGCHFSFPNGNVLGPNGMSAYYRDITNNRMYPIVGGALSPTSVTLDGQGNYIEITCVLSHPSLAVPANVNMNVIVWAVKANRMSVGYTTNDGLYGVPKVIHRVDNGPANERINVGALKVLIRNVPIDGSFRATITQSMVRTAYATLGYGALATADSDVRIFGVEAVTINGQSASAQVRYIELDDGAGLPALDRCRILFRNTTTATSCDVVVLCDGDQVYRWMEFSQPSKQVRGPYQWGFTEFNSSNTLIYGREVLHRNPLANQRAFSVPFSDVCTDVLMGVNGGASFTSVPFNREAEALVYISNAGGPYRIWADAADNPRAGISYNFNHLGVATEYIAGWGAAATLSHSDPVGSVAVLVVQPLRIPMDSSEQAVVYYEMAPYQGLGNDPTALARRGLGVVEAVSDVAVTTTGYGTSMWSPRAVTNSSISRLNFNSAIRVPHQITADVGPVGAHGVDYSSTRAIGRTDFVRKDNLNRYPTSSAPVYSEAAQHLPFVGSAFQVTLNSMVGTLITPESFDTVERLTGLDFVPEASTHWVQSAGANMPRRESTAGAQRMLATLRKIRDGWRVWEVEMHSSGGNATIQGYRWTHTNSTLTALGSATNFPSGAGFAPVTDMINANATSTSLLMLGMTSGAAGVWVAGVRVTYVPGALQYAGTTFLRFDPETLAGVTGAPQVSLRKGARLADVWGGDRAALQSSLVANGATDWPSNSPIRGVWVRASPTSLSPVGGQIGYVINVSPSITGTSFSLRGKTWPTPYGSLTALPTAAGSQPDMTGESNALGSVSGLTAQSYMIRSEDANALDEVSMGVSTGVATVASQYLSLLPGYAFDVFTPVGRPVFKRK
jgi:hypothetical protein